MAKPNKERYIKLKSVGSWLDLQTGYTFPINEDGNIHSGTAVHLNDCTYEWIESLEGFDEAIVGIWFKNNQKFRGK